MKAVNIVDGDAAKAIVISENSVLPHGSVVKELKLGAGYGKVIVVGKDEVRLADLNHCSTITCCRYVIRIFNQVLLNQVFYKIFPVIAFSCRIHIVLGISNKILVSASMM